MLFSHRRWSLNVRALVRPKTYVLHTESVLGARVFVQTRELGRVRIWVPFVFRFPIQMGMEFYLDSVVVACECARDQSLDIFFFSVLITPRSIGIPSWCCVVTSVLSSKLRRSLFDEVSATVSVCV